MSVYIKYIKFETPVPIMHIFHTFCYNLFKKGRIYAT